MSICRLQFIEGYTVVQDGFDAGLFGNKLCKSLVLGMSPFDNGYYLRFEGNFTHGVIEAPNFEFADLKRIKVWEI